eukprot:scaffold31362_cov45-Attheya_sp.AAC.5
MQPINDIFQDEHGCFVYRVLKPLEVRSKLNMGEEYRTGLSFDPGDLVSVDLVRPSRVRDSKNGPFLRLSDCSGWLFEQTHSDRIMMERLPVKDGLWAFHVDNYPVGMALRRHPFDNSPHVEPTMLFESMQLMYCDKQVTAPNGVSSYRVQGTDGWVFDQRLREQGSKKIMLLPEGHVRSGLFAFQVLSNHITIRNSPNVDEDKKTERVVKPGEIICCDIIRKSPYGDGNGPFLRLTDGSGWLFEKKANDPEPFLKEISIQSGEWTLKVLNNPAGIALRRHPIDRQEICVKSIVYAPDQIITCDRKIECPNTFIGCYRVKGSQGWIFDKHDNEAMVQLTTLPQAATTLKESSTPHNKDGWSVDFVRGAALSNGLKEVTYNPASRVISFQTQDGVRINIYYSTRTIGTALDHPNQGKTQLFRRKCSSQNLFEILQNPLSHTGKGYKKHPRKEEERLRQDTEYGSGVVVDEEEDLRNCILEVDEQIEELAKKRKSLLKSIRRYDDNRMQEAARMREKMNERNAELAEMIRQEEERLQKIKEEEEGLRKIKEAEEEQQQRELAQRTCSKCDSVFSNELARDQHFRDRHYLVCEYCHREFEMMYNLDQHKDAMGHWKRHT